MSAQTTKRNTSATAFSNILKSIRGVRAEWFSVAPSSKKRKKNDKADRRKGRCWQIPALSYCSDPRGETMAERGCWEKRAASVWVVLRRQPMAWKPNINFPRCTCDLPPKATTHCQASTGSLFSQQGLWSTKQRHDTNGLASRPASLPFVCHLKVVESSRGRGLTQKPPQYGTALKNLSPTKTLIVILSWCRGICSAPTAKSPAGLCGRWNEREGCCVYTCALSGDLANCKHRIIDGTRLSGL